MINTLDLITSCMQSERERQAMAYHEHVAMAKAIREVYEVTLKVKPTEKCGWSPTQFFIEVADLYMNECVNNNDAFLVTEMSRNAVTGTIELRSECRSDLIAVALCITRYGIEKGFTITF